MRRVLIPVVLALAAGCSPLTIIRQATPSPLTPQTPFALEPPTYKYLMVGKKPEAEYLARRKPEEQVRFQNDKATFATAYFNAVMGAHGGLMVGPADQAPGKFVIHSNVELLEPGVYTHFVNVPTKMLTRVSITDPNGTVLDELTIKCKEKSSLFHADEVARVGDCGQDTGRALAHYLRKRSGL